LSTCYKCDRTSSFLGQKNISLCVQTTLCVFIQLLMGVWIVSTCCYWEYFCTLGCTNVSEVLLSILLDTYSEVRLLNHTVVSFLIWSNSVLCFILFALFHNLSGSNIPTFLPVLVKSHCNLYVWISFHLLAGYLVIIFGEMSI
jgi:hypothetical protein